MGRALGLYLAAVAAFRGDQGPVDGIDRTAKLYVGGKQARPDGGYSRNVFDKRGHLLGQAPIANRKDIRNAVEAAQAASGWSKTTGHLRAQILYYIGENLSARAPEFAERLRQQTGTTAAKAAPAAWKAVRSAAWRR